MLVSRYTLYPSVYCTHAPESQVRVRRFRVRVDATRDLIANAVIGCGKRSQRNAFVISIGKSFEGETRTPRPWENGIARGGRFRPELASRTIVFGEKKKTKNWSVSGVRSRRVRFTQ